MRDETPAARTIVLDVPGWPGHLADQHVDVRLTAADGYSTQRWYSIASPPAPGGQRIELTVVCLPDVSPYLTQVLAPGDQLELRGPVGGWFVWRPGAPGPVLLAAGGSGVVPLMAMIRARAAAGSQAHFWLVYSARDPSAVLYHSELTGLARDGMLTVTLAYTRAPRLGPPSPRAGSARATSPGPAGRRRRRRRCSCAARLVSSRPRQTYWWASATGHSRSRRNGLAPAEAAHEHTGHWRERTGR